VGILGIREALAYAQERQLDLVEVSPTARPAGLPGDGLRENTSTSRTRSSRRRAKKQHVTHLKEVKLRPKIEEHDYTFKVNHGRRFLEVLHDQVQSRKPRIRVAPLSRPRKVYREFHCRAARGSGVRGSP